MGKISRKLKLAFFKRPTLKVAEGLLGKYLVVKRGGLRNVPLSQYCHRARAFSVGRFNQGRGAGGWN